MSEGGDTTLAPVPPASDGIRAPSLSRAAYAFGETWLGAAGTDDDVVLQRPTPLPGFPPGACAAVAAGWCVRRYTPLTGGLGRTVRPRYAAARCRGHSAVVTSDGAALSLSAADGVLSHGA